MIEISKKSDNRSLVKDRLIKEKTANDWIPITDIVDGLIHRKDGYIIGIIEILGVNLDLVTQEKLIELIGLLTEQLLSEINTMQLICTSRPIDMKEHMTWIADRYKAETNPIRSRLLKEYINRTADLLGEGYLLERRHHIIISEKYDCEDSIVELKYRMINISKKLKEASFSANICDEDDLIKILMQYSEQTSYSDTMDLSPLTVLDI